MNEYFLLATACQRLYTALGYSLYPQGLEAVESTRSFGMME